MGAVKLFVCGDVMTGRGIDQILPHPGDPRLHEPWVKSAIDYVMLAESETGPIRYPVDWDYVWGDALSAFERQRPDVRLVNLETAVTSSDDAWPGKGIHYRMHPLNLPCLARAGIDCCTLANNHVLDWGYRGLADTLSSLTAAGIRTTGAGEDAARAAAPAIFEAVGSGRVQVYAFGMATAGVPPEWTAAPGRAGVNLLPDLSSRSVGAVARGVQASKLAGDIVVASIHWGANWGYDVTSDRRAFAHALIDDAGVDLVHGHSSHHPLGMEIHRDRLILYGCGDFLNDYEGIRGHDDYRPQLTAAYFPTLDTVTGCLHRLELEPFEVRHFRLNRPARDDVRWLARTLDRESRRLGAVVTQSTDDSLIVQPG